MATHQSEKRKRNPLAILSAGVLLLALWCFGFAYEQLSSQTNAVPQDFTIHFIDVGQGDCTLIRSQGHAMLIDGGERGNEDVVIQYLEAQGVETLDYVVASHPHSDHIGGLAYGIVAHFPIGTIIAPQFSLENMPDTRTYETFLNEVSKRKAQGTNAVYARAGQEYLLGETVFRLLGPLAEDGENYNNDSVIIQFLYKNSRALFVGDAEKKAEKTLVQQWGDSLRSDLLKAGHHGSKTSSNDAFLASVQPKFVVISCGAENSYGHPSLDVIARCKALNIQVFRTDIDRTVVFASDGNGFRVIS